uniref:VasL domain-containing protein n=1 Tax=Pantoea sp. IMH TaxID=1267600 RepID=UPI00046A48AA|nr:VasL domain-containing protein [Pantoea sp. IMH]
MNRQQFKNGSDPRGQPDYAALRDEMMKLSHPARPDVNWPYAETLCLRLADSNGMDLQTAAWFTLASTHTSGLAGMDEGLTLIRHLTVHYWSGLWPANLAARKEIIAGLNRRLQTVFRTFQLTSAALPLLYSCKKNLALLAETLLRHDLKPLTQTDRLRQQIRQTIKRLEEVPDTESPAPAVLPLPQQAQPDAVTLPVSRLHDQTSVPEPVAISGIPPRRRRYHFAAFLAGAACAFLAGALMLWGWHQLTRTSLAEQQFVASLHPLPAALTPAQIARLRQSSSLAAQQDALLAQTRLQLKWLMSLPPDWAQRYGQSLTAQVHSLWPDNPEAVQLQQAWQRQTLASALPLTAMRGWHDGMTQLQQLSDRLNALDEKRGKYMTVSELKSQVFTITQAFSRTVPAEEQLRKLSDAEYGAVTPATLKQQSEQHLKELISRSALTEGAMAPP